MFSEESETCCEMLPWFLVPRWMLTLHDESLVKATICSLNRNPVVRVDCLITTGLRTIILQARVTVCLLSTGTQLSPEDANIRLGGAVTWSTIWPPYMWTAWKHRPARIAVWNHAICYGTSECSGGIRNRWHNDEDDNTAWEENLVRDNSTDTNRRVMNSGVIWTGIKVLAHKA